MDLGDDSGKNPRTTPLTHSSPAQGAGLLDPQQVTLAGLELCHSTGDIHCGLSVVPAARAPETIAATDDLPVRVDWLQYELRQGPCVGADLGETLVAKDLAADQRWPDFGRMCVAVMDLRSMVSIRVAVVLPDRARLNFYSSEPGAFDHLDVDAALSLARFAAPLACVQLSEFGAALACAAPGDCSRIAIAVGTVIARYGVTPADAFSMLCDASRDLHRALLGVAIDVVAAGRLPEEAIVVARRGKRARVHGRAGGLGRGAAHAATSIGGPELWHDPRAGTQEAT